MLKNKIKGLLCFAMFASFATSAQNFNQPYSQFGLGYIFSPNFINHRGMGGVSIAALEDNEYSIQNPASYANVRTFIFRAGFTDNLYEVKTPTQTFQSQDAQLPYISFAFPLDTITQWGLNVSLTPISKIGYRKRLENTQNNIHQFTSSIGEGGYTKFHIGSSIKVLNNLYFGANAGYMFGKHQLDDVIEFRDTSTFFNVYRSTKNITGGLVFDAGLIYRINLDSLKTKRLQIGLTANLPSSINTTQEVDAVTFGQGLSISDSIIRNTKTDGKMNLPLGYGAGIEYVKDNLWNSNASRDDRFKIAFDYYYRPWSQFSLLGQNQALKDHSNFALGMEWRPNSKGEQGLTKAGEYLRKIHYRMGANYAQCMYVYNGAQAQDFGVSLGASFPFGVRKTNTTIYELPSYIDFAVEGRQLGDLKANNLQQRYIILSVGLHLSQPGWFKRSRID